MIYVVYNLRKWKSNLLLKNPQQEEQQLQKYIAFTQD